MGDALARDLPHPIIVLNLNVEYLLYSKNNDIDSRASILILTYTNIGMTHLPGVVVIGGDL